MAAAADDDADKKEQPQLENERVRRDVTLQHGEQRTRYAGRYAAGDEHREFGAEHRHADCLSGDHTVADGDQPAAPGEARDIPGQPGYEPGNRQDQPVAPLRRIERRGQAGDGKADATAGEFALGQRDLGDDQREGQRGHGEIKAGKPQRRQSEEQAAQTAQAAGSGHRQRGMHAMRTGKDREAISADRQQADVADGQLARIADNQIEPADQHPVGPDQRGQVQLVKVSRPPRQGDQGDDDDGQGDSFAVGHFHDHTGLTV